MQNNIPDLAINLNFWSALSGLLGAILIFFFGIPQKIDSEGDQHLLLQGADEAERKKAQIYKRISYFGVLLLIVSFLLQLFLSVI